MVWKVKGETTQTGQELRHEGQNSIPTVTGTGAEQEGQCDEETQAAESIGAGEGI